MTFPEWDYTKVLYSSTVFLNRNRLRGHSQIENSILNVDMTSKF